MGSSQVARPSFMRDNSDSTINNNAGNNSASLKEAESSPQFEDPCLNKKSGRFDDTDAFDDPIAAPERAEKGAAAMRDSSPATDSKVPRASRARSLASNRYGKHLQ